jgi:hypothetical protein
MESSQIPVEKVGPALLQVHVEAENLTLRHLGGSNY